MERRNRSASPGVKPAATTAICMTCSWKIGTPMVRESTSRTFRWDRFRLPCPGAGAGRDAPCRPGSARAARWPPAPPGRSTCAAAAWAACSSARATRSRDVGAASRISSSVPQRRAQHRASTSTFSSLSASRSSLSHCTTRAVGHGGVLDRHQARELAARDHEAARVLRQVAESPSASAPARPIAAPRASPGPARRRPACAAFPSCHPTTGARARRSRRCPRPARGRCRAAAARPIGDDHRGQRARSRPYLS